MEYLMTYGWAILVIAIVLGALFQLGVFSGSNLAPRGQPGACRIERVGTQASTQGLCQGLLPEYTAFFSGAVVNTSTYIVTNSVTQFPGLTVSAWVYFTQPTSATAISIVSESTSVAVGGAGTFAIAETNGKWGLGHVGAACGGGTSASSATVVQNVWYNIVLVLNNTPGGGNTIFYANDTVVPGFPTTVAKICTGPADLTIGGTGNSASPGYFNGIIENVQVYNTSFNSGEVQALYQEGIGGAPVAPQYVVGWWPLNGNLNDYGGLGYNGQLGAASNTGGFTYNNSWERTYSPP